MSVSSLLITVRENEYKPLLDRDNTIADIKEHLSPWLVLIRDVTNYGTNLIPRCITSCEKKLEDAVLIAALLRQIVAMLDGVEILLSSGATHTANLQMRAIFEASVYVDWILQGDSEKKAGYYYVHNLRRMRVWASRTQPGSSEWQEFRSVVKDFDVRIDDKVKDSAKVQILEIDRILSQPKFTVIKNDFDAYYLRRKGRDPAWYVPLGVRNLAAMSRAVGRGSLYALLYSGASEVMHSSNYGHHFQIGDNKLTLEPIRFLKGFETVFRFSVSLALHTFQRMLERYRPGERAAFSRKYLEKWQKEFLNFPKIQYRADTIEI